MRSILIDAAAAMKPDTDVVFVLLEKGLRRAGLVSSEGRRAD
jgi:hypothetical protein